MLLTMLLFVVVNDDAVMTRTVAIVTDPLRAVTDKPPRLQLLRRRPSLVMTMVMTTSFRRLVVYAA